MLIAIQLKVVTYLNILILIDNIQLNPPIINMKYIALASTHIVKSNQDLDTYPPITN